MNDVPEHLPAKANAVATTDERAILVVDDSTESRELLSSMLRQLTGREIHRARNGREALSLVAAHPPLLTFLDIQMEGLDGLEVLWRIRTADPNAFVVMVSGESSARNVRNSLSAGAGAFVVKPFRPAKIVDALKKFSARTGIALALRVD